MTLNVVAVCQTLGSVGGCLIRICHGAVVFSRFGDFVSIAEGNRHLLVSDYCC